MSIRFQDVDGNAIVIGTKVELAFVPATVVALGEPDGDVDGYGRSVEIPPSLTVRFANGDEVQVPTSNVTRLTWADYPDGPDEWTYEAHDELEVKGR
jgi:hypothetical protein